MEKIKIKINGKEIITEPNKTILEIVREKNLDTIPTLCHDKRLNPFGSCFLCVVEIKGIGKLVPSCATAASDGMEIITNSERITASRKTALELLMSNHYADCIGPCEDNCPSSVAAQNYIALISMGKNIEAVKVVKENNPMPLSIGRVCVRNCEDVCRRKIVDETVGINYLKRYAADIDAFEMWKPEVKEKKNKKIAVIGGGPAGLTCAYYLTAAGYSVTIYEKLPELGGMLKYGIPEYRLPKRILDKEIKWITDLGIDVKTNIEMGKDFSIDTLFKEGFSSIFLGVGAHKASTMRLKDEEKIEGIYKGIDYLREMQTGNLPKLKGTAVIVGGGNTAIDAARNAFRWGAEKVKIVYRRSIKEMPAHIEEIEAAQAEGVEILFLTNPTSIISEDNRLTGIKCVKMELKTDENNSRPRPVPIEGSEFDLNCDYLIGAIGQQVDTDFAKNEKDLKLTKWNTIVIDENTYETSIKGVFAGGDAVSGPWTAIAAIAQGKEAAEAIKGYLTTGEAKAKKKEFKSLKHIFKDITKEELFFANNVPKVKMSELPATERKKCFDEVELGLAENQAKNEASRCLECGCSEYDECNLRIYADEYGVEVENYIGEINEYKPDFSHPFIVLDPNKCIECGRCVRTCSEKMDVSALGFVNRGLRSIVKPALELPLLETTCVSCGNCIDTCPTGAISEKFTFKNLGKSKKYNYESICNFCSIGCKINFKLIDNDTFYVSNSSEGIEDSINDGYLCIKGRFGHRFYMNTDRIKSAAIKTKDEFKDIPIEDAIDKTVKKLKEISKQHGKNSIAVFASPKLSNEELYLIQKFARVGLGTNNVISLSNLEGKTDFLDSQIGFTKSTVNFDFLKKADIIINVSEEKEEENLILEYMIRREQVRGAKFVQVGEFNKRADMNFNGDIKGFVCLLNDIMKNNIKNINSNIDNIKSFKEYLLSNETFKSNFNKNTIDEFTNSITDNKKKIVFIINKSYFPFKKEIAVSATNYLLLTERLYNRTGGIIIGNEFFNGSTVVESGLHPDYLPGFVKVFETSEIEKISSIWECSLQDVFIENDLQNNLKKGNIKGALIFGEDPFATKELGKYFEKTDFIAVSDFSQTKTTKNADIIIPSTIYIEQDGSYTSMDGRTQRVNKILTTELKENWKIISEMINIALKRQIPYDNIDDLRNEMKTVNRFYDFNGASNDLNSINFYTQSGKPSFKTIKIENVENEVKNSVSELYPSERFVNDTVKRVKCN